MTFRGADGRIRTGDLILTKAMVGLLCSPLYALIGKMISYVSKKCISANRMRRQQARLSLLMRLLNLANL